MALQVAELKLRNGVTVTNAYVRVDTISGYKGEIAIGVNAYVSEDAFKGRGEFTEPMPMLEPTNYYTFTPDIDPEAEQIFGQAYQFLKKSVFPGAIDC